MNHFNSDYGYMSEKADFTIYAPFVKQVDKYPELAQYENLVKEAEMLCKHTNAGEQVSLPTFRKVSKVLLKLLNVSSDIGTICSIIVLSPIHYVLNRLCSWGFESIEQELAKRDLVNIKLKMKENMRLTTDKRSRAKYRDMIEKIDDNITRLENNDYEAHVRERAKITKDNKKKANKVNKKYAESADDDYDAAILLDSNYYMERADVQAKDLVSPFTPSLCDKYPEMKKYKNVAMECEKYFKDNDIKGTNGNVVLGKLNKVFNEILITFSDVGYIVSILNANILGVFLSRIIKVISMNNEVDSGVVILNKNKESLIACKNKCKNPAEKAKIDKLIKQCDDAIEHLKNDTNEDHEKFKQQKQAKKLKEIEMKKANKLKAKEQKIANRKAKREQFGNKTKPNSNMNESVEIYNVDETWL